MNFLNNLTQKGTCSICDEVFYDFRLREIDSLFLCPKHVKLYKNSQFYEFACCESTADNPNNALFAQELKDSINKSGKLSFIRSNYIEIDGIIHSRFTILSTF